MSDQLLTVPGSSPGPTGTLLGYPNPAREMDFRLNLRRRPLTPAVTTTLNEVLSQPPHLRKYPTHAELTELMGAYPEDVAAVEAYFAPLGIRIKDKSLLLGTLTLTGSVADLEQALHTEVAAFQGANQARFLATTSDFQLPARLLDLVEGAQPLQRPVRKENRLPTKPLPPGEPGNNLRAAAPPGYSVLSLAKAYQFPEGLSGEGQVIGIVELGGKLNQADIKQFFSQIGVKKPRIVEVGIAPVSTGATEMINNAEVALDLEVVGALAPQARLVVYYGASMLEAVRLAVADEVNKPTVLSISWAGSEYNYSAAEVQELNQLLYQATVLGITVVAASADHGAYNGLSVPNVSLPASNPLVLACGGTIPTLVDDVLTEEVVWNELNGQVASGGGYSQLYQLPYYQQRAVTRYPYQKMGMRGVPDVAADASTVSGYQVVFGGQTTVIGGTSGATPLVAALMALLGEKLGYRLGYLNTLLYELAGSDTFRPITQGNNQVYAAAPYWNPCTGLGSIVGTKLLQFLQMLDQANQPAPAPPADDSPEAAEAAPS